MGDVFWVLFGVGVVLNVAFLGYKCYRRRQRGSLFPPESDVEVLHREMTASGRSHKSLLTRFGKARNCLKLVVTPEELWVTAWFPFAVIAETFDLQHRIRKADITSVRETSTWTGTKFEIAFTVEGADKKLDLYPKNAGAFREALAVGRPVAGCE